MLNQDGEVSWVAWDQAVQVCVDGKIQWRMPRARCTLRKGALAEFNFRELLRRKCITEQLAVALWGTPLEEQLIAAKATIVGSDDSGGGTRAVPAQEFYLTLRARGQSQQVTQRVAHPGLVPHGLPRPLPQS